jgi:hypothetical protein
MRSAGAVLLTLVLLAVLVGCGDTATRVSTVRALRSATLPSDLRVLERKMERLQVNSERYSQRTHVQTGAAGKRESFDHSEIGEVSLSPAEGESFTGVHASRPRRLVIDSTSYFYSAQIAPLDGGRPWVRRDAGAAMASFPYHGLSTEHNEGGQGSYAGLINLMDTAVGKVGVAGRATADGQQATEFTAVVDPAMLLKGISERQLGMLTINNEDVLILQLHLRSLPTRLHVFITESGLPIRVVASARMGSYATSETTDMLATNTPINLKRPSTRQTISEAQFAKLLLSGRGGHSGRPPIE